MDALRHYDVLCDDSQLGPYPDHLGGEVIRPTGKNSEKLCREYPLQE